MVRSPTTMLSVALAVLLFAANINALALFPRDTPAPTCQSLQAKSNDGDRKIAIVIDSSGSMTSSDPHNLRLAAGRSLVNDWLISSSKATASVKADLVTVINFDSSAFLDYPLGDPGGANSSFSKIGASGGTFIAGGVKMGIEQLTTSGSGDTASRSGMIVFTDGETRRSGPIYESYPVWEDQNRTITAEYTDSDIPSLVDQINHASSLGIRVSFGFLDSTNGLQDKRVLLAIQNSMGIYNTIFDQASSNSFINLVTVNGLTTNDNPQGSNSTLVAGLSLAHVISGSQTQVITYNAQSNENINLTIQGVDSGRLDVKAVSGGKTLGSTTVNSTSSSYYSTIKPSTLNVKTSDAGVIEIQVTSTNAPAGSIFVVGAKSNLPSQNCTVGVGSGGGSASVIDGKRAGAIAACVIIPFIVIGVILGGYMLFKHFFGGKAAPPTGATGGEKPPFPPSSYSTPPYPSYLVETSVLPPPSLHPGDTKSGDPHDQNDKDFSDCSCSEPSDDEGPTQDSSQNPQDKKKHRHKKLKNYKDRHHHHLSRDHPCFDVKCPLNDPLHMCQDPNVPCACEDEKCKLNKKDHKCKQEQWQCRCTDKECPVAKKKKAEWRKKTAKDIALTGIKEGVKVVISPLT